MIHKLLENPSFGEGISSFFTHLFPILESLIHPAGEAVGAVGDQKFQKLPTRSEDAWRGERWDGYR
jgi:hypothetical protein